MAGILDGIPGGLILDGLDDWHAPLRVRSGLRLLAASFRTPSAIWTWILPL